MGALINYYLSLWIGRPIVYKFANSRFGHACLINEEKVRHAEEYFDNHGAVSTFIGRLIPAVRQLISIPAGLARMNIGKFVIFTGLGALVWNCILAALGYWLGKIVPQEQLYAKVEEYNEYLTYIGLGIGVVCVLFILWNEATTNNCKQSISKAMLVAPSLLSANFANLQADFEMLNSSNADYLHVDVMDGVFVPNISIGFPVIKAIQRLARKPLDVHMMIVEPQKYISQVRDCGAEIMNVHFEACTHLNRVVHEIKEAGMKAGVTLNPATPVFMLEDIISELDLVLIMSVNPGFGGQAFIENSLNKVGRLRRLIEASGSHALIEVDGGVNEMTGAALSKAGADILVAGSYVFKAPDPMKAIDTLKSL